MPQLIGVIILESPMYQGNMTKVLFARQNKHDRTPLRLHGYGPQPGGSRMDSFLGKIERGQQALDFDKLLPRLYRELFGSVDKSLLEDIKIDCSLQDPRSWSDRFYDIRMGIKINRDRMVMESNAGNYKMETVFKNTPFKFTLTYPNHWNDQQKKKIAILMGELEAGRAWFGAGKSKGLGKIRLVLRDEDRETVTSWRTSSPDVRIKSEANIWEIKIRLKAHNPVLVSWPFYLERDTTGDHTKKVASWMDEEIARIEPHLQIKRDLASAKITDWDRISDRKFLDEHRKLRDRRPDRANFQKAVENDENLIAFYEWFKSKAETELKRDYNCDYRQNNEVVSRSKIAYDRIFSRMMTILDWKKTPVTEQWQPFISGSTIKGALRVRAEKILETLGVRLENEAPSALRTNSILNKLFGKLAKGRDNPLMQTMVTFSDAYLDVPDVDNLYSSLDSVRVDPKTGKPVESAKMDFLYAFGADKFSFSTTFYIKQLQINNENNVMMGLLFHLIEDMCKGEIAFGGQKTSGMGWLKGEIEHIRIRTGSDSPWIDKLNSPGSPIEDPVWKVFEYQKDDFKKTNLYNEYFEAFGKDINKDYQRPEDNKFSSGNETFISHRFYSGYSGTICCRLEVLRPIHIKESGEATLNNDGFAPGWDFFHMSPPANENKPSLENRIYAIPSKTLKGLIRHTYTALTDPSQAKALFGFVGEGRDASAYMGRVNISFGRRSSGDFAWYGMPYLYGHLKDAHGNGCAEHRRTDLYNNCRFYSHKTNFIDHVLKYASIEGASRESRISHEGFSPCRFAEAGSIFTFNVDYWNLTVKELKCLLTAIQLEEGLAHKIGKGKYLGFGSCRIIIDEEKTTVLDAGKDHWRERYTSRIFIQKIFAKLPLAGIANNQLKELLRFS